MAVNLFTNAIGDNNWGTAGNWSQGTVPINTDGHVTTFDATSPDCTVNATNRTCAAIDFTGYVGALTMTFQIIVNGSVTLSPTMSVSGSAMLNINATSAVNLTSNGYVWPNDIAFSGSGFAITLLDDVEILGALRCTSQTTGGKNLYKNTSEKLTCQGLILAREFSSTAEIEVTAGTIQGPATNAFPLTLYPINGNISFAGSLFYYVNYTFKYVSSTYLVSNSSTALRFSSVILDTNSHIFDGEIQFANLTGGAAVITIHLLSDLNIGGLFNLPSGSTKQYELTTETGAEKITCYGGITVNQRLWAGSNKIILKGGTWSGTNGNGLEAYLELDGNVTISGNIYFRGTLKYISGVITPSSPVLRLTGSLTYEAEDIQWQDVYLVNANNAIYTLNEVLNVTGTIYFAVQPTTTFDGLFGFNTGTALHSNVSLGTIFFKEDVEYIIRDLLEVYLSQNGSAVLFTSSHATTKTKITLKQGAQCKCLANFTRIDSSNGRTINTFSGTVTDCVNVRQFFDLGTVGSAI